MQLKVKKSFKWAHRHVDVQEYNVGDVIDTEDEDLIRVAIDEGWATKNKEAKQGASKDALVADPDPAAPDANAVAVDATETKE
jgi:hypothetical protein